MNRYTVFTLGLALALTGVGVWANDTGNTAGAGDQAAQPQAPAPADANQAAPQNQAPANNAQPDQNQAQPNTAPPNQNPAAPDNAQPNAAAPDNAQPNAAPPNAGQPNQPPSQTPPNQAPAAAATNSAAYSSPLQEFASNQVNEVGDLSRQMDQFRAAGRKDAVMALYHMIRDHTLMADAARNVLARRGEPSEPTIMAPEAMANSPDDMIRHDLDMHQQALSQSQQLLANASTPEEKSIYQRAVNLTNKHVSWLTAMNQGQTVQIGFFGPTTPLNRIAGYREETTTSRVAGYKQSTTSRPHHRTRRGRYRHYTRVRRYR